MQTKKMTLNIPVDLHKRLKTMAVFEETTMTDIILKEVKKVVEKHEKEHKQN